MVGRTKTIIFLAGFYVAPNLFAVNVIIVLLSD